MKIDVTTDEIAALIKNPEIMSRLGFSPLVCKECQRPLHYCHGDKVFDCCWCGRVVTTDEFAALVVNWMAGFKGEASYVGLVPLGAHAYELPPSVDAVDPSAADPGTPTPRA